MKKFIAFLLTLIMLISLFSCSVDDNDKVSSEGEESTTSQTQTDPEETSNKGYRSKYKSVLEVYRKAINVCPNYTDDYEKYASDLGITDEAEKELFFELLSSGYLFYPGRGEEDSSSPHYKLSCGYAKKDLNGDNVDELVLLNDDYMIVAIFSMSDGKPVLLGNYIPRGSCWIDGEGLIHLNGSSGADYSTNAIYKVAKGGASLELIEEFGTNGHEFIDGVGVTKYYKSVNGEKVEITEEEYNSLNEQYEKYLGTHSGAAATKEYSGLVFKSLFSEAEIAMEMYSAVLKSELKVYEVYGTNIEEPKYLKDCRTPYMGLPLSDLKGLEYIYIDVDGDSISELIINCSDTLVFRYYEGAVYFYPFTFREINSLNTDGSYSWNYNGENFEYGEKSLAFDGTEFKPKELWRIINDGEPNAEYYIEDKQVTEEEISKYLEENPKTRVEFAPLEVSWQNKISSAEAVFIAHEYWKDLDIEKNGYIVLPAENSSAPESVYVIVIKWYVVNHYSTFDEIWIDKNTGEAIIPYWTDGK